MRTTLSIDNDALRLAKQHATRRSIGLGKAVSELVRRGAAAPLRLRNVNGIFVVDLPPDSPKVTPEHVRALEEEP